MKTKNLINRLSREHLLELYKSAEVVREIMAADSDLQAMFIKSLPAQLTVKDLVALWADKWKNITSDGFTAVLKELSYEEFKKEFKKINHLPTLIKYWYATPSHHLREVIGRVVAELLSRRHLKLNKQLVLDLYLILYNGGSAEN